MGASELWQWLMLEAVCRWLTWHAVQQHCAGLQLSWGGGRRCSSRGFCHALLGLGCAGPGMHVAALETNNISCVPCFTCSGGKLCVARPARERRRASGCWAEEPEPVAPVHSSHSVAAGTAAAIVESFGSDGRSSSSNRRQRQHAGIMPCDETPGMALNGAAHRLPLRDY